ncbi:TetR/AcrR family transcriptional regulator [Mycobacterium sp. 236(2023)]|uniref:TetR/AcrR family transcriptional regulator n=1 Tax=Mycobacterium sp. 236(2023) TaxID=3038163 RepID=UPI00241568F1|nr:TetR/AcrR family transcriptional regulator [Mycobacterium sp. 236(2023)]MDG4665166.1 TetR family transcriptional regulator [Mycobacterium sp. 236(2023)]
MAPRTRKASSVLPYGALDREHLVKHLLELARRVGVANVTMRALATEAGTSASSVYYHVKDKAALLELLAESVLGGITIPSDGEWEQRIAELHTNAWRALVEVPGIAALLQQRPLAGAAGAMDTAAKTIMAESGWSAEDLDAAHVVLYIHLLGSVQLEHHLNGTGSDAAHDRFLQGLRVILTGLRTCRPSTA